MGLRGSRRRSDRAELVEVTRREEPSTGTRLPARMPHHQRLCARREHAGEGVYL